MRSILGFFSLLAVSVLGAGVIAVVASSGSLPHMSFGEANVEALGNLDLGSFLLGLAGGILLSAIARISWGELPRRAVSWLLSNERTFARLAWAALFVGILFFY